MGHEDVRITFNIYGHLFDDDEDALVERLDRRARGAARFAMLRICWVREKLTSSHSRPRRQRRPCDQGSLRGPEGS
jgi:hypothetical protein